MHSILVPVDGSPHALAGVRHAVRIALRRGDAALYLVNAQPRFHRHVSQFLTQRALELWRRERSRAALDEARRIAQAAGVRHRAFALAGADPAAEVAAFAARERADEAVLGVARGPAWLRALAGSFADRCAARLAVPVTLIATDPPRRIPRWALPAAGGALALLLAAE